MKKLILLISLLFGTAVFAGGRVVVLDVGEGQAVLVKNRSEGILIDTGHPGMSTRVLKRLEAHGVSRLEYLILTHLHPDHAGGYFRIREAFPEAIVLHSGHPLPADITPDMVRWVNSALGNDPRQRTVAAGDRLSWRGFRLEFFWPAEFSSRNLNRHSLVIRLRHEQAVVLVMGDADRSVEQALLRSGLLKPVQLLVAGHHGAADTGDEAFLKLLSPDYTVISVNSGNIRGYPSPATVMSIRKFSRHFLRTDRDGEICFTFSADADRVPGQCRSLGGEAKR